MNLSAQTINDKNRSLVLVVDKIGLLGESLAQALAQDYLVIYVSKSLKDENRNIIHIPFRGKIPQVPDGKYERLFIVDDGSSVTKDSVISFISLARPNSASLYFLTSIRNIDTKHAETITTEYTATKVLEFGDLFQKALFLDKNTSINRFILQARRNKRIDVPGDGLSLSFPITLQDSIKLILKASHLELAQRILLLFQEAPVTDLSLAHMFQKVNPDITIDYSKEVSEKKIYMPEGGTHVITKYDIEQKIKELDLESGENRKITILENKNNRKNYLKPLLLIVLFFLFVLLLPLISTLGYSALGYYELNNTKTQIERGNLFGAKSSIAKSKTFFQTSDKTADILISESRFAGLLSESQSIKQKIDLAKDLTAATQYFLDGAQTLRVIYSGKSQDPNNDFRAASNSFKSALTLSQKVDAQGGMPKEFKDKISKVQPLVDLFANSSEILPGLLGFDNEKTYLILFQDNSNPRPGGGKISSAGVVKIKNAKVQNFKAIDVSALDAKFNQHVEPPFAIRRYIPAPNWKLGESNFSPDFVRGAISASNFYSIESGQKVDGVIAVDATFIDSILGVTGPMPVKGQMVSSGSLPGLIGKGDDNFIGDVGSSIFAALQKDKKLSVFSLAQKTGEGVTGKDLLFAFKDEGIQNVFIANNWSGSLWDNRQDSKSTINDFLGLYEANLGPKNPSVSRSISKKTVLDGNGKISSRLQIGYKNNSAKDNYKNYIQLVLPLGSTLNSILVNNNEMPIQKAVTDFFVYESKGFKPPQGIEVDEIREMNKSVYGFLINIPGGQAQTVAIDYDLPGSLSKDLNSATYSLKIDKQPGVDEYPFDFALDPPNNYKVISGQNPLSTTIKKDTEFIYKISQK